MLDVTPLVGVWIEIPNQKDQLQALGVTPLVGVWIEITKMEQKNLLGEVTPLVGVWIEIFLVAQEYYQMMSLPLWECGLKFFYSSHQ